VSKEKIKIKSMNTAVINKIIKGKWGGMMKKIVLLFFVLSHLILSRETSQADTCSFKSYDKKGVDVFYQCFKVKESDLETFKVLGSYGYAKDKKNIYYNGEKLKEADRRTFIGSLFMSSIFFN
jgi:membrane-bound acyltransferase YfiQ involved in biofilm formation